MNNSSTLHQLLSAPSTWTSIDHISAIWQTHDALLLLGEAAQGYNDIRLKPFDLIYLLQADADILNLTQPTDLKIKSNYQILSYDDWAKLLLKYSKHISWK